MDKYEYKVRSEEISKLIEKEKYAEAVKIADTIDWRRVKSAAMLLKIAALYRISRRNEDSREMLMLAYERYPTNRSVVYSLCELSIELDDVVAAIEYYKQFAKLAPRDNGVYTLRYRILEAQEASLEERIDILEELKRKDYQEEWAYELAYLYHRVGLSTKCVEECDDIILWFGDGPYVMKAMELKAKHVPLTEIQQQNYNIMLGNAGQNYSGASYDSENYDSGDYAEAYDGQNYNDEAYTGQGYDTDGYAGQSYDAEAYAGQNQDEQNYDAGNYDAQAYNDAGYDAQGYGANDSNEAYGDGYSQYSGESYSDEAYQQDTYAEGQYSDGAYDQGSYQGEQYAEDGYGQENYSDEQYADNSYAQNSYVDDGYGNLSYVDRPYQDNGYTSEFYVEQAYDEYGNLMDPQGYSGSDYAPAEDVLEDSPIAPAGKPKEYRNGFHVVENTAAPAGNAGDMSQYNTINLQKVVAESMKELFPDDNDDVFAEDREKYNSGELSGSAFGDTRIFASAVRPDDARKKAQESAGTQTGRVQISQMVTGVLEKAPEPHTGAIKKVLVPGEDARLIKSDSDLEELRDTTEKSVEEEHNRMEDNDENVYHEQSLLDEIDEASQEQTTGPMKLDDVLVQWERMKQDNARRNQEEIKKRVLTQTGKLFADFDNSLRSGILGELEREEKEALRSGQEGAASRRGSAQNKGADGFLDADVTGDIPQQPASDDDFDVEFVTDHTQPPQLPEAERSEEPEEVQEDSRAQEVSEDTQPMDVSYAEEDSAEEETEDTQAVSVEEETEDTQAASAEQKAEDAQGSGAEQADLIEAADQTDPGSYTEELYTEELYAGDAYAEDSEESYAEDTNEYTEESYVEDTNEYTEESYAEDSGEYTENAYAEDSAEYTEESYAEDSDEYTENVYAEGSDEYVEDSGEYAEESYTEDTDGYTEELSTEDIDGYIEESYADDGGVYTDETAVEDTDTLQAEDGAYHPEDTGEYEDGFYAEDAYDNLEDAYSRSGDNLGRRKVSPKKKHRRDYQYNEGDLDPEEAEDIAQMAKEDALKTQEIKMNTADLSSLSEKIVATTKKEASGARREELRDFTPDEQTLFENFAVTRKIKKQILYALENMTLAAYTGNVIITGDAGLDTIRMAKNLIKEYQALDESFSGKLAKITGEKINQRNIKDVFEKLNNGGIIIEKANGMSEEKLYELATNLNQDTLGIVVIMEDTKKEITKLLEKQAMIVDYFNIRIDLMEMDNNALVAYAKNYALALEYSIDELGTLALYTRIANMQSGNHVVTKDEVRDIIDEAIWKSKKSKIKNFVDVLFARRYDNEDMIVLKERDFM